MLPTRFMPNRSAKINPFRMIVHIFDAPQRSRHFFPPGNPVVQLGQVGFKILFKSLLMLRKIPRQASGNVLRGDFRSNRIQHIVRISLRVKIALCAIHTDGRL